MLPHSWRDTALKSHRYPQVKELVPYGFVNPDVVHHDVRTTLYVMTYDVLNYEVGQTNDILCHDILCRMLSSCAMSYALIVCSLHDIICNFTIA
jgi:hypothetical protein